MVIDLLFITTSLCLGVLFGLTLLERYALSHQGIDLLSFIRKTVGNGEDTLFLDEIWLDKIALKYQYPRLYTLESHKQISVVAKMRHASLDFTNYHAPRGGVEEEQQLHLLSRTADLLLPSMLDRWVWSSEASGDFSVKSDRNIIDDMLLSKEEVPTRWVNVIPIKINIFAWRLCLDKLPMRLNLSLRGPEIPSILCPLCSISVESTSHLFFSCPLARQVRNKVNRWWELEDPTNGLPYSEFL